MPAMHSDMRAFVRVYERVVLHGEWANHHYKNDVGDLSHDDGMCCGECDRDDGNDVCSRCCAWVYHHVKNDGSGRNHHGKNDGNVWVYHHDKNDGSAVRQGCSHWT